MVIIYNLIGWCIDWDITCKMIDTYDSSDHIASQLDQTSGLILSTKYPSFTHLLAHRGSFLSAGCGGWGSMTLAFKTIL